MPLIILRIWLANLLKLLSNFFCLIAFSIKLAVSSELIEKGIYSGSKIDSLLKEYLNPMIENDIDKLVLGCTHYPLIKDPIKKIINESIEIIECSEAVALQTERILIKSNLINSGAEKSEKLFYTNGDKNVLNSLLNNKFEILMV